MYLSKPRHSHIFSCMPISYNLMVCVCLANERWNKSWKRRIQPLHHYVQLFKTKKKFIWCSFHALSNHKIFILIDGLHAGCEHLQFIKKAFYAIALLPTWVVVVVINIILYDNGMHRIAVSWSLMQWHTIHCSYILSSPLSSSQLIFAFKSHFDHHVHSRFTNKYKFPNSC